MKDDTENKRVLPRPIVGPGSGEEERRTSNVELPTSNSGDEGAASGEGSHRDTENTEPDSGKAETKKKKKTTG